MDTIDAKIVKIRKPRKCWGCATPFPIGSKLQRCVNVDCGEIYSVYFCEVCQEWFRKYGDTDGVAFGELKDCSLWKEIHNKEPRPTGQGKGDK